MRPPVHDGDDGVAAPGADAHRDSWELLPWLVNGRLRDAERARVEAHLAGCEDCRAELAAQRVLRDRIAADDPVTYSPAASFEKLWSRIEELEREVPETGRAGERMPRRSRPRHGSREDARAMPHTRSRGSNLSRWLVAAVVVQSIALSWLAYGVLVERSASDWQYRTVTSPPAQTAAATRVRVVFARDTTVSEMQRILAAHGLSIAQESSASEIFTLVSAEKLTAADAAQLRERLQAERAIRFVEVAP